MAKKQPNPHTCERCPHRYSEIGCPCWITAERGIVETDGQGGEQRVTTGCMWEHIPRWFAKGIACSNRPAAAIESLRNEMVDVLNAFREDVARVNRVMIGLQMKADGNILPDTERVDAIEHNPSEVNGRDAGD